MTEQEQVQLLPCPFCGGEADILTAASEIWITCANCGADGAWKDTRAETIAAWNTRHTATAEALEVLRWYAKENNWRTSTVYMCGHSGSSNVTADGGKRARAAIAKIEGEQP
jgi:Lar family restriction alleviation protein